MRVVSVCARWAGCAAICVGAALGLLPAAQAQDIVLGQIGPFTGLPVPDAIQINQGAKAYIAQVNKAGGINGRKVTLFDLDDTYKADGFVAAFEQAMQRRPVALISPVGSAAIKRMLDDKLLDKHDVVVMNGVPGAEALRSPGHPRFFHVRAGDKQQLEEIVKHSSTLGMNQLVVLHQDIPMGVSGMKVVTDQVAAFKGLAVQGVAASVDPAVLSKAAADVARLNPHGVIVIGAPPFAAAGVAQLRKMGVTQSIFVLADTAPGLLLKVAGVDAARGVGIAQIYPNPGGRTKALVREFQAAMKSAYPEMTSYASFQMEGYVSARVVVEAMRRIRGEITPASLARALQTMGEVDFDGLRLDFAKSQAGGRYVDIAVMDAEGRLRF